MSYPDEWEEQVEAMIDDLAAANALPPCRVPLQAIVSSWVEASRRRFVVDAIFAERTLTGEPKIFLPGETAEPSS